MLTLLIELHVFAMIYGFFKWVRIGKEHSPDFRRLFEYGEQRNRGTRV
jgi:hypothetical protein